MGEEVKTSNEYFQFIRGLPIINASWFSRKNIENAMDYMPKPGDTIIASYPKTGTTWVQYIVLQIISKGTHFPKFDDMRSKFCPYIEMAGVEAVEALTGNRMYKHHIPYNMVRKNDEAKTIYIYRNPEDTIVSFYHFYKDLAVGGLYEINAFLKSFVEGNNSYGNYFEHVLSFYRHREDKNLLMLSYENLYANRRSEILRIADFLGQDYKNVLVEDEEILHKIVEQTSFEYMKQNCDATHPRDKNKSFNVFRKGIVGDGKSALNDEQRDVLKDSARKVIGSTEIFKEWYPDNI